MKIGIGLPNQVRDLHAPVIPQFAAKAEQAGFSSLGTIGRIAYPGIMDTVALAAAAGATSTIGLVTTVLLAPVWPPALLAKELAGIQAVSGGRLTVGLGSGGRPDDFVVEGTSDRGRGKRMNAAVEAFQDMWTGKPVGGGDNPGVPGGSIDVPLLFGGGAPAALQRMARWGVGYIGGAMPPQYAGPAFDAARAAWQEEGREGEPRLVVINYVALGDPDKGRANVHDYYSINGDYADQAAAGVNTTADAVKATAKGFEEAGVDELIFITTTDDLDEIPRLADTIL